MDIEKLLGFVNDYLSDYIAVFIGTLRKPTIVFEPSTKSAEEQQKLIVQYKERAYGVGAQINPKLFGFVLISIFIGSTLNALIPGKPAGPDIKTTFVVLFASWLAFSVALHLLCLLFQGKGTFLQELSICLQLLATLYVVSSFSALVWGIVASLPQITATLPPLGSVAELLVKEPAYMYFFIHFILLAIYLPIAIKHVHKFGWLRQLTVGILVPPVAAFFGIVLFIKTNTLSIGPPWYFPFLLFLLLFLVYTILKLIFKTIKKFWRTGPN